MSYRVNAEWDNTGWWVVTVPDVPGAITQCRRLEQVRADAAEVIEIQTCASVDPESLDVEPIIPGDDGQSAAEVRRLRAEAYALTAEALARTSSVVATLHEKGFALRDIGSLTGISYQRAQQLVNNTNPHRGHDRKARQRRRVAG